MDRGSIQPQIALQPFGLPADHLNTMRMLASALLLAALALASGCAGSRPVAWAGGPTSAHAAFVQEGWASYYGSAHQGRRTASGVKFDEHDLTAAHRSLPFGTQVRVTNLANAGKLIVPMTNSGPLVLNRV